eukprot:TRINITY_DN2494_c0_g1_i3.p1 TRINITY_DN2494_c0_g1~~TRINITY_DN2494_c0_g1_i3.p1  ORF type:complete len:217 (+),score=44.34 TRINITY_DN2494_c0_g1_i3:108-758(+)
MCIRDRSTQSTGTNRVSTMPFPVPKDQMFDPRERVEVFLAFLAAMQRTHWQHDPPGLDVIDLMFRFYLNLPPTDRDRIDRGALRRAKARKLVDDLLRVAREVGKPNVALQEALASGVLRVDDLNDAELQRAVKDIWYLDPIVPDTHRSLVLGRTENRSMQNSDDSPGARSWKVPLVQRALETGLIDTVESYFLPGDSALITGTNTSGLGLGLEMRP